MIYGLILAGGRSERFGSEKALARLGGLSLLERAHARLSRACEKVAVSTPEASAAAALARAMGAEVLPDPYGSPRGPLSGVLAGLDWLHAAGGGLLLTVPCDAPLAPDDLAQRLLDALGDAPAAMARTPAGLEPLNAVWRSWMRRPLALALADGLHPAAHRVLAEAGAAIADFRDPDAFINVNTPEDFARAERLLAAR